MSRPMYREDGLPDSILFMAAGLSVGVYQEIAKRWPVLTEEERQTVIRRVTPLRDVPLEELMGRPQRFP